MGLDHTAQLIVFFDIFHLICDLSTALFVNACAAANAASDTDTNDVPVTIFIQIVHRLIQCTSFVFIKNN